MNIHTPVTTYTLGNATFTAGDLIQVILIILGACALTYILANALGYVLTKAFKRWDNRKSLQRKLSRWYCVRPRARL